MAANIHAVADRFIQTGKRFETIRDHVFMLEAMLGIITFCASLFFLLAALSWYVNWGMWWPPFLLRLAPGVLLITVAVMAFSRARAVTVVGAAVEIEHRRGGWGDEISLLLKEKVRDEGGKYVDPPSPTRRRHHHVFIGPVEAGNRASSQNTIIVKARRKSGFLEAKRVAVLGENYEDGIEWVIRRDRSAMFRRFVDRAMKAMLVVFVLLVGIPASYAYLTSSVGPFALWTAILENSLEIR